MGGQQSLPQRDFTVRKLPQGFQRILSISKLAIRLPSPRSTASGNQSFKFLACVQFLSLAMLFKKEKMMTETHYVLSSINCQYK